MRIPGSVDREEDRRLAARIGGVCSRALHIGVAWSLLVAIDVVLRVGGFARLCAMVRAWRTVGSAPLPSRDCRTVHICAAVDRARMGYLKHARCLQSAAVATCLLRLRGVAADLVIGVRRMPFTAHAWVEVDQTIVMNGRSNTRSLYTVIDRL